MKTGVPGVLALNFEKDISTSGNLGKIYSHLATMILKDSIQKSYLDPFRNYNNDSLVKKGNQKLVCSQTKPLP